ncbi:uncharacterized protein LOC116137156 isoform X2 [Pistacia vera]|uniref:uncharacterized protein LOC116137156 isoform X2 n=1 Tax=Pistacia vera TaxID=55513 RepID=UPI001263916D|nr:uncharacterized protein LOC116137156 isoform X2 [Pistacia vera]
MGKRGGAKRQPNLSSASHKQLSLREQNLGKKQTNTINVKSRLKLDHLQNLATWAGGEASVPSLAAFFGHHLAAANESMGLQPDPSLFSCQRCETILQPGFNCTVRIEKTHVKARSKRKKSRISTQNSVVYKCQFCLHRNLKKGTPIGHMKEINPPKVKRTSKQEHRKSTLQKSVSLEKDTRIKEAVNKVNEIDAQAIGDEVIKVDEITLPAIAEDSCNSNSPVTPSVKAKVTLDGKKTKRNKSGTKKPVESEINSATTEKTVWGSSKKRKSWTSLKEIAERMTVE